MQKLGFSTEKWGQKAGLAPAFFRQGIIKSLALCVVCLALFGMRASFAAAPVTPLWAALGSSVPVMAKVQVIDGNDAGLSLLVTIPGFSAGTHEDANGRFTTLHLPGSGVLQDIGKPALPVIRRLIMVPENSQISCTFTGTPVRQSLSALGMPLLVMPLQPPIPKIPGAVETAGFVQDAAIYTSLEAYPASPVAVTEAGILFGYRLFTLEVCPLSVTPSTGDISIYTNLVVAITFGTTQAQNTVKVLTVRERGLLVETVLNPPPPSETITATQKRLLIIAPNNFTNGLNPFISHKTSRGWLVDCFATNSTGATSAKIQAFIKNRYTNSVTRPDALLLVGDVAQIPCFAGKTIDTPDTDLYYGCMDGVSDWQPEFPVGRFSVSATNQLDAVLAKSIAHEQSRLEPWIKRVSFMASEDNYIVSEGTHNEVIAAPLTRLGYACEKLYCYTSNATPAQVRKAFNKGCVLGIYSGHGDTTYWADGPRFYQSDINRLTNAPYFPIVCSFACLTGQFSIDECFAETWLRAPAKGAVAILSSSVTSYWNEDDILEKSMIEALFDENQPLLGIAVWRARQLFLGVYGSSTTTTRRYFEQYNLLGDPALEMVGLPVLTNGIPVAWFTSQGINNANYALELQEDRDGDGMTALQEYLAGTNPGDSNSSLRLVAGEVASGKIGLRWLSDQSLFNPMPSYQILWRTNLSVGTWMPRTNLYLRTPPTNEVQLAIPPNTPQLFYRISISN
ncbi:MAG: C25 family cysteine peptidase [bacterium]|jgi:hypothetical protein